MIGVFTGMDKIPTALSTDRCFVLLRTDEQISNDFNHRPLHQHHAAIAPHTSTSPFRAKRGVHMANWRPTGAPQSLVRLRPPFILFPIWDTTTVPINPLCFGVGSAPRLTPLFTFIPNS